MPRRKGRAGREFLGHHQETAEQLRRELLGVSLRHPYFRDLNRQLRTYARTASLEQVVQACRRADIVYLGEFHALSACQHFAAELLAEIARGARPLALGIELLYTRQQRLLERRQAGLLDDPTFLRRVHYREEWGYPWDGYRELLDRARDLGVSVHALDSPPRGGFDGLARRDEHAARQIVAVLAARPRRRLLVLFGESHVSKGHIPRRVRARLARAGLEASEVTVFQNPDSLYWPLVSRDEPVPAAVEIDETAYAVFHTSPLEKYEAYRQVLDRWRGDVPQDEEVDLTPAVHHLISGLLRWLGVSERRRIDHRGGWAEELADAFPEVYSGAEAADLLVPVLREHRRRPEEIEEAKAMLSQRGALYDCRSNTMFLQRYLPGRAAGEGARFLRAALSGRLFDPPEESWEDPAARAYGAAFNEALAYLGSRLVDPASDFLTGEERMALATAGSLEGLPSVEMTERVHWLEAHRRFEASRRLTPPEELMGPLRRSRPLRRSLARDLGHRLGRLLVERVRDGRLDQRSLRQLFARPLEPGKVQRHILQLLRGRWDSLAR